jgi:hypothetical protein
LAGATRSGPGGASITGGGPNPPPGLIPLHSKAMTITSTASPPAINAIRRISGSTAGSRRRRRE